jgi:hypothetical protein
MIILANLAGTVGNCIEIDQDLLLIYIGVRSIETHNNQSINLNLPYALGVEVI